MSIRIIVADDRDLIRAGVREFVRGTDLEVVGEGALADAPRLLSQHAIAHLLILGSEPIGSDSLDVLEQIKTLPRKPKILLYAARISAEMIAQAIADGVSGLLLHDATHEVFLRSIHNAARGDSLWSREELRRAGSVGRLTDAGADVQLTKRESEVIVKMVEGLTNKQIAQSLEISYETVKEHVQHILRKLGVTDRTQAAVWAVRHGLA